MREPLPVDRDSRRIVSPGRLVCAATLHKFPAKPPLTGLLHQFWSLPDGVERSRCCPTLVRMSASAARRPIPASSNAHLSGVTRESGELGFSDHRFGAASSSVSGPTRWAPDG